MRDPGEGVTAEGAIRTGAARERVPTPFMPVLDAAVALLVDRAPHAGVYVYGSVATGQARVGGSDVDLLTVDAEVDTAREVGRVLSVRFADVCRAVEVAAATADDLVGEGDAAYGGRVFVHHYCVHLSGPDHDHATASFPADARAARGFNGDIGRHAQRWRAALDTADPSRLARRVARKTLLAVAGLVSVHDATWTTDRGHAARRWAEIAPRHADDLAWLLACAEEVATGASRADVEGVLERTVDPVVEDFAARVGLWDAAATGA